MTDSMTTAPTRPDAPLSDFQTSSSVGALLSVDQVAERLGTPTRFVRRLVAQRRIGFCRIGRYIRISDNDVDAFIEAGRVPPAPWSRSHEDLDRELGRPDAASWDSTPRRPMH